MTTSATRLSKAYLCGKMARPHRAPSVDGSFSSFDESNTAQKDGNLRHALMEYYLKTIVAQDLELDSKKMKSMARGENWSELSRFLENKNQYRNPLGKFNQLDCRKKMKKLRRVVNFLSEFIQRFGKIIHVRAESSLGKESPIQVSDSVRIGSGEIDATFVLEDSDANITVIVIDWKRSLSNKIMLERYRRQCQVYIRCIQEEPLLVNLTPEKMSSAKVLGFLIGIGGHEGTTPDWEEVGTDSADIDTFLEKASEQYESGVAIPGHHCSSWCKWAFADDYCRSISSDTLSINLLEDVFWNQWEFHSKWFDCLTQFKIIDETIIEPAGKNVIHFHNNRELHLKGINYHITLPKNGIIRAEGSLIRKTPTVAYMRLGQLKVLEG